MEGTVIIPGICIDTFGMEKLIQLMPSAWEGLMILPSLEGGNGDRDAFGMEGHFS